MEYFFCKKTQFSDHEYDMAMDLELFKCKKDMLKHKFEKYIKLEELLNMKEPTIWSSILQNYIGEDYKPTCAWLHCADIFQLSQEDVKIIFQTLCRCTTKKKTIVFYGNSNCGKSILANALLAPIAPGYIQRDGGTNVHWLENIYRKSVILWEEPSVNMSIIEDVKLLLGGETIAINRKNKSILERPRGPAVVVTTNNQFWYYQPETLLNRCHIIELKQNVEGVTSMNIPEKDIIYYLLYVFRGR